MTDPRGTVTCYQYDALNRLTTKIADNADATGTALRATTKYGYDAIGNVLSLTDPRGTAAAYQYNAVNELTTVIKDSSDTVGTNRPTTITLGYDAARHLTSESDATGLLTCYQYDALNRLTTVTRASGTGVQQTTGIAHNANDNITAITDPSGATTTMTYDPVNRLLSVEDPNLNITTMAYDAAGNLTTLTNALLNSSAYAYDPLNRLISTTNALTGLITYSYDGNSNVTGVTDADGNRTTMSYDALNRLTKDTDPLNNSATYLYDVAGNLTSSTNRNGQVINSQWDPLNRLTTDVWLNSSSQIVNTVTFAYDLDNNVTMASNNAGTYAMSYNALNEMTSESEPFSVVLTMQYDGSGHRTQMQDSLGGTTTYTYDALHRLASVLFNGSGSQTPLRVDLAYTQQNEVGTVSRYSDLAGSNKVGATSYSYDQAMRLTNIQDTNGGGSVLESLTYTYDQADRLTSLTTNGSITTYSYDAVNELTTVTTSGGTTSYSYDANGNRTMAGYVTGTGNQLLNDGTWTYTYDKEGNVTQKYNPRTGETWHYTYDNLNELTGVADISGIGTTLMQATYVYDVAGNRIEKDVWTQALGTTTVTRYAYDHGSVWAQLNSSNGLQTRYIRGNTVDEVFARESATGVAAWYLADKGGSITNLLDGSGTLQDTITYDGYGNAVQTNPSFGDQVLYAEGQYDAETELQYNSARYYDATTGRWINQDPLAFVGGDVNLYRYAGNSPTNASDPTGLSVWSWVKKGVDFVLEPAYMLYDLGQTIGYALDPGVNTPDYVSQTAQSANRLRYTDTAGQWALWRKTVAQQAVAQIVGWGTGKILGWAFGEAAGWFGRRFGGGAGEGAGQTAGGATGEGAGQTAGGATGEAVGQGAGQTAGSAAGEAVGQGAADAGAANTLSPLERMAVDVAREIVEQRRLLQQYDELYQAALDRASEGDPFAPWSDEGFQPGDLEIFSGMYNNILQRYNTNREVLALLLDVIQSVGGS